MVLLTFPPLIFFTLNYCINLILVYAHACPTPSSPPSLLSPPGPLPSALTQPSSNFARFAEGAPGGGGGGGWEAQKESRKERRRRRKYASSVEVPSTHPTLIHRSPWRSLHTSRVTRDVIRRLSSLLLFTPHPLPPAPSFQCVSQLKCDVSNPTVAPWWPVTQ